MNCRQARKLFSAYLEAELKPKEVSKLEVHLAGCLECRSLLEAIKNLAPSLQNLPEIEPAPELVNRLYLIPEKIRTEREKVPEKMPFSWKFWLNPVFQPVLTTLTIILVALSLLFFTSPGKSWRKSAALEIRQGYSQAQKFLVRVGILTDKINGYRENFLASLEVKKIHKSE